MKIIHRTVAVLSALALLTLAGCRSELPPPNSKPADSDDPSAVAAQVARGVHQCERS